ncbi:GNAT family N-acetyltransferase [Paenibacillus sp. VTT E-133280]|uniref:GNAT family N-acetyltransferase n=1 Tax=Paenibacillus sp. VTT E-133280 TaxID=1986222 RepID=UPI0015C5AE98|nr:GNAT family protein [Paenibacillus sp. VTT E-133280]
MELITDRLILRGYTSSDSSFYEELEQNPLSYKYENTAPDAQQIKNDFLSILSQATNDPRQYYDLAICRKPDMKLIGNISIKLNWEEIREWEMGWVLLPDYWKMGYATEAVKTLIGYAFKSLNVHRVVAYANAENIQSEKVMIRAGMIKDGVLRETRFCNQQWCNEIIYSSLEQEWT